MYTTFLIKEKNAKQNKKIFQRTHYFYNNINISYEYYNTLQKVLFVGV